MNYTFLNFLLMFLVCSVSALNRIYKHKIDIVFIVDASSYKNERLFRQELQLIPQIVSNLTENEKNIRFGLITYSDQATLQMGLGYVRDNKALLRDLWRIKPSGSGKASLCYALRLARTYMFKDHSKRERFVIVFQNTMWNLLKATSKEIKLLENFGVRIMMIVLGDYLNKEIIEEVIDTTNVIYKPRINLNIIQMNYIYTFIVNNVYHDTPMISSTTSRTTSGVNNSVTQNYIKTTKIGSSSVTSSIMESTEMWITQHSRDPTISILSECQLYGQLVITIDASSSVSSENFNKMLNASRDIMNAIWKIHPQMNISIATYGSESKINLPFQMYNKTVDIGETIKEIKQQGGLGDLSQVLSLIQQELFGNTYMIPQKTVLIFSTNKHVAGVDPVIITDVMKHRNFVTFFVIRIGNETDRWVDNRISYKEALQIKSYDEIESFLNHILRNLCRLS